MPTARELEGEGLHSATTTATPHSAHTSSQQEVSEQQRCRCEQAGGEGEWTVLLPTPVPFLPAPMDDAHEQYSPTRNK